MVYDPLNTDIGHEDSLSTEMYIVRMLESIAQVLWNAGMSVTQILYMYYIVRTLE